MGGNGRGEGGGERFGVDWWGTGRGTAKGAELGDKLVFSFCFAVTTEAGQGFLSPRVSPM